jgi:hypothetical protein
MRVRTLTEFGGFTINAVRDGKILGKLQAITFAYANAIAGSLIFSYDQELIDMDGSPFDVDMRSPIDGARYECATLHDVRLTHAGETPSEIDTERAYTFFAKKYEVSP